MNLTQNDRLKQVTFDTLIVGVDVGSKTHFCRAFDWREFELSRRVFKFSNTGMGFITFLRWTEELMNKTKMKRNGVTYNLEKMMSDIHRQEPSVVAQIIKASIISWCREAGR